MEYQYNVYVQNNYNKEVLRTTNDTTLIINGFSKLLLRITDDVKKRFIECLKNVKDIGKFSNIIVDRVDNLKKLEYDEWYKRVVQNNYGIWVGNGIADQTLIKTNIGFKKINNEIPVGFGIVVKNTKTNLVKLITDEETISKVDESL